MEAVEGDALVIPSTGKTTLAKALVKHPYCRVGKLKTRITESAQEDLPTIISSKETYSICESQRLQDRSQFIELSVTLMHGVN